MLINFEKCSIHECLPEHLKKYLGVNNITQRRSHGLATWKDELKSASTGIASWRTNRQSNCTQFQLFACMITTSRTPRLLKIPEPECPDVWILFQDTNGHKHGIKLRIPWYFLNEFSTVIHEPDCSGKRVSSELWNLDGRKFRTGNVCFVHRKQGCFFQYVWMTFKWLERSRIWFRCARN